ncbi:MAG: UDP-N-acetylmuramoyl-L-alanyl-D-glutamate--2,6-diaminopimelate ligase [Clostridiales bacterium]|nr:UDP-N-acetylmuramoyl-L-alanyl-D-glutamate--2,6-diaminopimelate ligase [Clostridiales bacterium]
MKLNDLMSTIPYHHINGNEDCVINAMTHDSRKVEKGGAFIAIKGYTVDGHDYIEQAIEGGAGVIFYNAEVEVPFINGITYVALENTEQQLPDIAGKFYQKPSERMTMIGVTGTNGKTSITLMLESMLKALNERTAVIGTIENHICDDVYPTQNTTPDALTLNAFLAKAADAEVSQCVMEVSSHALKLDRVRHVQYDYAIFTNLTEDHLDFHPDFEDYFNTKSLLFQRAQKGVMINLEDSYGRRLVDEGRFSAPLLTYGLDDNAAIYAKNVVYSARGTSCRIVTPKGAIDGFIAIPGDIYVLNTLACISTLYAMGYGLDAIETAIKAIKPVRGRLETIEIPESHTVIVDFAHTPDALENVLSVVRKFTAGKMITVFGCGGDRDRKKRPIMGDIAYRLSDVIVVTSDNPRTEVPEAIIDEIVVGIPETLEAGKVMHRITDRRKAIADALDIARDGDTVVIAGKGHETYQIIGRVRHHFDDAEEVRKYYGA